MLDQCGDNNNGEFFPLSARSEQSNEDGRDAEARGENAGVIDEGVGAILEEEETGNEGSDVVEDCVVVYHYHSELGSAKVLHEKR